MQLIDTHCHIDVADFDADRTNVLTRARAAGVAGVVVPGINAPGWQNLLDVCAAEADLYPALGLHPVYLEHHQAGDVTQLEAMLTNNPQVVAVGEIGLDFYLAELDRARQQVLFEVQLEVARNLGLPVILHVRKAHDQVLATLKRIRVRGGTAHAFNGSLEQARQYMELGFKLGFGGALTFERATKLRRLSEALPLEGLVLETDAPDMSGAAYRGERNSPEYLPDYAQTLAEIKGVSLIDLARVTTANARALFFDTRSGD